MEAIKKWLKAKTKETSDGIALLKKHSKNLNVINSIEKDAAKGEYKQAHVLNTLEYHLAKIIGTVPAAVKPKKDSSKKDDQKDGAPADVGKDEDTEKDIAGSAKNLIFGDSKFIDLSKLPDDLKEKYVGQQDGWKAIGEYHTILQDETLTEEKRAETLDLLLRTADAINDSWMQIRAFCDVTPEVLKVEELPIQLNGTGQDLIDAYRRLGIARDNISRVKKELERVKDPEKRNSRMEKITGWELEIEACKKTLEGIRF